MCFQIQPKSPFYPLLFKNIKLAKPLILLAFQPFCFSFDSNITVSTCKEEIDSISNIYFLHIKKCTQTSQLCVNYSVIVNISAVLTSIRYYPINVNCYQKAQFGTHCVPSWKNGIKLTHISQSQKQLRLFQSEITCIFSGTLAL